MEYVEIEGDSFSQTNAKTYTVILRLKAGIAVKWYDGSTGEKTTNNSISHHAIPLLPASYVNSYVS